MPIYEVTLTWTEERLKVVEVEAESAEDAESMAEENDAQGAYEQEHVGTTSREDAEASAELKHVDAVCPMCKNPNGNMLLGELAGVVQIRCRACGATFRTE
jgi:hypothetical protein